KENSTTDANSTGLVMAALRSLPYQTFDTQGAAAIEALQIGCDGPEADRGSIAFNADQAGLPNALATTQALFGLSDVALPQVDAAIGPGVSDRCAPVTTETTATTPTTGVSTTAAVDEGNGGDVVTGETLARTGPVVTGATLGWLSVGGLLMIAAGSGTLVA